MVGVCHCGHRNFHDGGGSRQCPHCLAGNRVPFHYQSAYRPMDNHRLCPSHKRAFAAHGPPWRFGWPETSVHRGLVIFVLAAALAGTSPSLNLLIGAKVLQGVGSAMIQGNGMATIISVFSGEERGKALGSHLSVVGTGAIPGPALGGILVSALGWRAVFFVNVPIGLITIAVSLLVLAGAAANTSLRDSSSLGRPSFDWGGAYCRRLTC